MSNAKHLTTPKQWAKRFVVLMQGIATTAEEKTAAATLDFSPESLGGLDCILQTTAELPDKCREWEHSLGCYFGEVLCRHLGYKWTKANQQERRATGEVWCAKKAEGEILLGAYPISAVKEFAKDTDRKVSLPDLYRYVEYRTKEKEVAA